MRQRRRGHGKRASKRAGRQSDAVDTVSALIFTAKAFLGRFWLDKKAFESHLVMQQHLRLTGSIMVLNMCEVG